MNKNLVKGYICVIFSAVIFGLMPLMAKFIYKDGVNPPTLVFLRNFLSLPILALLTKLTRNSIKVKPTALPRISAIAIMGCCVTPLLLFSSYNHIPSSTATVFHFIYPAVTLLGEFVFLKAKIKNGHIISMVLCVFGVALFYNPNDKINFIGGCLALLSGVTYAVYIILLSGFKHKSMPSFTFSFYVALICSAVMFLVCIFTNSLSLPQSLLGWFLSLIFAIGINVGAVVLFQKGTFLIGGGRASIISTFEPITSLIAGVIIFNEHLSVFTAIGTVLVIVASVLIAVYDMKGNKE